MTQMRQAHAGIITQEMRTVAEVEHLEPEQIRQGIAAGRLIIPANVRHPES